MLDNTANDLRDTNLQSGDALHMLLMAAAACIRALPRPSSSIWTSNGIAPSLRNRTAISDGATAVILLFTPSTAGVALSVDAFCASETAASPPCFAEVFGTECVAGMLDLCFVGCPVIERETLDVTAGAAA
jgi:hypothetical protein